MGLWVIGYGSFRPPPQPCDGPGAAAARRALPSSAVPGRPCSRRSVPDRRGGSGAGRPILRGDCGGPGSLCSPSFAMNSSIHSYMVLA